MARRRRRLRVRNPLLRVISHTIRRRKRGRRRRRRR